MKGAEIMIQLKNPFRSKTRYPENDLVLVVQSGLGLIYGLIAPLLFAVLNWLNHDCLCPDR